MIGDVEKVALLALVYRELSQYCSVGPRTGPLDILEDIESGDEELNLIRMIGSTHASELDWAVIRLLTDPDEAELLDFAKCLKEYDQLRFEALVHAWPEDVRMPSSRLDQIERWQEVKEAMERFAALGLTLPFNEAFDNYIDATAQLSGRGRDEVLDEHFAQIEDRSRLRWAT
jgi:hypothetical protein